MIAKTQVGSNRKRAWKCAVREYPIHMRYQRKVAGQIPIIRLRPAPGE